MFTVDSPVKPGKHASADAWKVWIAVCRSDLQMENDKP